MKCADVRERLDDYADRALEPADRREVDAHLAGCPECRAESDEIRSLLHAAGRLPPRIEPPRDLWPGISRTIDRRAGLVSIRRSLLVAAAVALVVLSSGITAVAMRGTAGTAAVAGGPAATIPSQLQVVESQFLSAARDLETALRQRRTSLAPAAAAVVERNLRVIDAAIEEAREALAGQPANTELAEMLWRTYRTKLDLLQRAASL